MCHAHHYMNSTVKKLNILGWAMLASQVLVQNYSSSRDVIQNIKLTPKIRVCKEKMKGILYLYYKAKRRNPAIRRGGAKS